MSPESRATAGASTQDRIRRTATELFADRGYGGTSIADIAQGVGVSKAGLYNYYDSKEELLMELMSRALEAWSNASRPALAGPGSFRERLWRHLESAVQFTYEQPHQVAILRVASTQIGGDLGRRVREFLDRYSEDHLRQMRGFFAEAIEAGEVADAPGPEALALTWRSFLDGLLMSLAFRSPEPSRIREQLEPVWQVTWRGLAGSGLEAVP